MSAKLNLQSWRLLAELSKGNGLMSASVALNLDLARCTRLIAQLEEELSLELVDHTRRPLSLTFAGRELLPYARELVRAYGAIEESLALIGKEDFLIRIGIPVNSPRAEVNRNIFAFHEIEPKAHFEIWSDCTHDDVLDGSIDVAMLPYRPPSEGLVIFDINRLTAIPFASKKYIQKYGRPQEPEELSNHFLILRSAKYYPKTTHLFKEDLVRPLRGTVAVSGDVPSGISALLDGRGISLDISLAALEGYWNQGLIAPVLNGWHRPYWDVTVVMNRQHISNKRLLSFVHSFIELESEGSEIRARKVNAILKELSLVLTSSESL